MDVVHPHPQDLRHDLGEGGLVALALRRQPDRDVDPAGRLHLDVRTLVGADAGAFDVAADADADLAPMRARLVAVRLELLPPDQRLELGQRRGVVAGVVDQRSAVLERHLVVVGHLLGGDEVDRAYVGAVLAQGIGDRVHHAFHGEHALGPAGAPVRRDDHRRGVEGEELDPVRARLVRAEQLGRGDDGHDDPVGDVGPVVVPDRHVQPQHAALVVEADTNSLQLLALVGAGDEVLAPVLGPLDRVTQLARRPRHEHLLRPGVHDLGAEPAADVGGDAVDLHQRQPELRGDGGAHPGRGLRRRPHAQCSLVGIPAGQHALALHGHGRAALDVELEGERVRCGVDRCRGVAHLLHEVGGDVAGDVVVHQARALACLRHPDDGGQDVVGHLDALGGVLGQVPVPGDHHHDRLADVVDLALGEGMAGPRVGQGRVRDQQRQGFADPCTGARVGLLQVVPRVDGEQAVDVQRVGHVDVHDARVGVRAAHEGGGVGVGAEVVEVPAAAGDQPRVLAPDDARPDERRAAVHGCPP